MNKTIRLVSIAVIELAFAAFGASAGAATLEGTVKDASGRAVTKAIVRIEAKNFSKVTNTDARGHYTADGLAIGTYKVTLLVNGKVKASILDARTKNEGSTQLNFDLTGKSMTTAPAKKKTHLVWVPGETGSLIASRGQWVEVDEKGVPVKDTRLRTGAENIDNVGGNALHDINRVPSSRGPGGN